MIRERLVELARQAFRRLGYEVRDREHAALERVLDAAMVDWVRRDFSIGDAPRIGLGVIFSKDRALQLHALLQSWFAQVEGAAKLVVLWTASSEHEASYMELRTLWAGKVEWVREQDFRADLLRVLEKSGETHLFFVTDDALVIDGFRMDEALAEEPRHRIVSLCHAPALDWCFIADKAQKVPPLQTHAPGRLRWNWADGEERMDWRFPLSIDGKFFAREEMLLLLSHLPFRSPNTLEVNLQVFLPLFIGREGVCFEQAKLVNVPCNAVQTQYDNLVTGAHTTEELLVRWQAGERIRWESHVGLAPAEAERKDFGFVPERHRKENS